MSMNGARARNWTAAFLILAAAAFFGACTASRAAESASGKFDGGTAPPGSIAAVFDDPASPVAGNPQGDLEIAEFFDYRCPYCRHMNADVRQLLAEDHGIRFVFKEWPIFGGPSTDAARVALAAKWQGKYLAVHDALMTSNVTLDERTIREIAAEAGADLKRLDRDLEAHRAEIDAALARNDTVAQALGFRGTPGLIIGKFSVPGALDLKSLRAAVAEARKDKAGGQ